MAEFESGAPPRVVVPDQRPVRFARFLNGGQPQTVERWCAVAWLSANSDVTGLREDLFIPAHQLPGFVHERTFRLATGGSRV